MADQITTKEIRQMVEQTKFCVNEARDAVIEITGILDSESSLSKEDASKVFETLQSYIDSWDSLHQIPGYSGNTQLLSAYESWLTDLEKAESIDSLRNIVNTFFHTEASSEKYSQMLEDAKRELQAYCRLEMSQIASSLHPYDITIRAIQGEDISDEDEDILMENEDAIHQVYFKRLKMSINPDKDISPYMDGSCPLLTSSTVSAAPIIEEPIKPLWDHFAGYVSNQPIYIERNSEAEKTFQVKEFASRIKSHPFQVETLEKINSNVIWPIVEPEFWNEKLDDITYFLNHGYVVRVGFETDQPLFYMLSAKGRAAIQYLREKIKKQPKIKLTQGNYPDIDLFSTLNLRRMYTILNYLMIHKPAQCSFMRNQKEWYHTPYACACEKDTGVDFILTSGFYSVGNEKEGLTSIHALLSEAPDVQLRILVANMNDSQCILENLETETEQKNRISFIETDKVQS